MSMLLCTSIYLKHISFTSHDSTHVPTHFQITFVPQYLLQQIVSPNNVSNLMSLYHYFSQSRLIKYKKIPKQQQRSISALCLYVTISLLVFKTFSLEGHLTRQRPQCQACRAANKLFPFMSMPLLPL